MKTIVVIGGSRGIGQSIVKLLLPAHKVISISRTKSDFEHINLIQYAVDVLCEELPEISVVDGLAAIISLILFSCISGDLIVKDTF